MRTIYLIKSTACLFFLAFMACASTSFGAHEISNPLPPTGFNVGTTAQQWDADFDVTWSPPADMASDTLVGYAYKWSESETALTHTTYLGNEASYDGILTGSGAIDPPTLFSLASNEIAGYDGEFRYLHVQTVYDPSGSSGTFTLSNDTVLGPLRIDNVCTGTFRLLDNTGNDLVSTRETTIYIEVIYPADIARDAADDIIGIFIDEDGGFTSAPVTQTDTYSLLNSDPGPKTIYVKLEDAVGNKSLYSDTFTLLDPVSIDPNTATIDLAVIDTQVFTVAGDAGTYDWILENGNPEDGSGSVAQFSGPNTGVNSVTVQGLEKGTFTLKATANSDGSVLTSGTITVTGSAANLDVDGNGQVLFNTDGFLIFRYLANFPTYYGDSWITGVVAGDAARTTAADIEAYIQQGTTNLVFDIDGNGEVLFNTDGFLIFRYLANFPTYYGDSWITGVVAGDATRSTAAEIEAYLITILP